MAYGNSGATYNVRDTTYRGTSRWRVTIGCRKKKKKKKKNFGEKKKKKTPEEVIDRHANGSARGVHPTGLPPKFSRLHLLWRRENSRIRPLRSWQFLLVWREWLIWCRAIALV